MNNPSTPQRVGLHEHPGRHADHDAMRHRALEEMVERGIYRRPAKAKTKSQPMTEGVPAD
jgi:hypothetical protein